jgi:hypothetical protein
MKKGTEDSSHWRGTFYSSEVLDLLDFNTTIIVSSSSSTYLLTYLLHGAGYYL